MSRNSSAAISVYSPLCGIPEDCLCIIRRKYLLFNLDMSFFELDVKLLGRLWSALFKLSTYTKNCVAVTNFSLEVISLLVVAYTRITQSIKIGPGEISILLRNKVI
jgi:hypothetical protein